MVRPVREVATAIEEQDVKQLTTLPGIGAAMAERIVAKLRRKMAKFALLIDRDMPGDPSKRPSIVEDAYEAMLSLGHSTSEAREKVEAAIISKPKAKSVDELLIEVYRSNRDG